MSPAKKRAFVISLRRALSIASATARSTISTPTTSRARGGEREADRPDAAVEVEDALGAAQAGELDRGAVEHARPSRCSSGRTPRARSGTRGRRAPRAGAWTPFSFLVVPPWVLSPRSSVWVQNRPSQSTASTSASASNAPGEVTRRTWSSPVRRPSRTTRLRSRPCWPRRSQADRPCSRAQASTCSRAALRALGDELAVGHRDDLVPAAGRVEAAHQRPVLRRAERVLDLVAVAPLLHGGHDRLLLEAVEPADAAQRVADLLGLDRELALVGEHLPRRAGMVGDRRDAVGRRLEDLDRPRLRVRALASCRRRRGRGRRAARRRRRRRSRRAARPRCRRGRASRRSARARRRGRGAWMREGKSPIEGSRATGTSDVLVATRACGRAPRGPTCGSRWRPRSRGPCGGRPGSCRRARGRPRRR